VLSYVRLRQQQFAQRLRALKVLYVVIDLFAQRLRALKVLYVVINLFANLWRIVVISW
jgi:hypothetical protein